MSIQWGIPLLRGCLPEPIFDRLQTAANDPYFTPPDPGVLPTLNGKTGELLKEIPLLRMFRVSRRKFRSLCMEGIDVEVRAIPCGPIAHNTCIDRGCFIVRQGTEGHCIRQ